MKLPGGKNLVVDSKVPLEAYLDAADADDDVDTPRAPRPPRAPRARAHGKLGQKRYWQQFDPAPEFVVMFLGDEAFYRAALDHDRSLLDAGAEAGVIIASPTTLIAPAAHGRLRLAAGDGRRERPRNRHARPRALRRLGVFAKHFAKVGRSARHRRRRLQRGGQLVRDARARDRAEVPGARGRRTTSCPRRRRSSASPPSFAAAELAAGSRDRASPRARRRGLSGTVRGNFRRLLLLADSILEGGLLSNQTTCVS